MKSLPRLSMKLRLLLCVSLAMLVLVAGMAYRAVQSTEQAYEYGVNAANRMAVLSIINQLDRDFSGLSHTGLTDYDVGNVVWDDMPDDLADDRLDPIREITREHVSVFRWDPVAREYVRDATTILIDGVRAAGTFLPRGAAYDAMVAGEPHYGSGANDYSPYLTYYHPVFDSAGNPVSVFASGYETRTLATATQQKLMETLGFALVALGIMLILMFLFLRKLMRPLDAATRNIVALSEGDLEVEIMGTKRHDEIGRIANSLEILKSSMRRAEELNQAEIKRVSLESAKQQELATVVEALTGGLATLAKLDLTSRIESTDDAPFPSEYEGLRASYNQLVDNLSDSIEAIRDVAEEVTGDAREIASSSADLSSRTENQAATLQQSAAALEELSESVRSTAANAADAESATGANLAAAKQTGDIVKNAVSAMTAIEASSQKITQIISVIDDIAFQTNLLALNAGVEAARAGEAGRGFAVVASEVRALAQHSSASAQEIKSLIASSTQQVESGSKLVRQAGEAIGDIGNRVDRVAGLVSDIAISAKEQSLGVTEINTGVRDLDAATQSNAAMAEEASAASEGLTNAADRLSEHLARFKVADASIPHNWAAAAAGASSDISPIDLEEFASSSAADTPAVRSANGTQQSQIDVFQDF